MTDSDTKANIILQEAAARQAIVDRLLGRSVWNGFVTSMIVPVIANVVFLLVWSTWARNSPESSGVLVGGALSALLWISIAVMNVAGRLRALATILERSGVLAQFVAPAGKLPNASS